VSTLVGAARADLGLGEGVPAWWNSERSHDSARFPSALSRVSLSRSGSDQARAARVKVLPVASLALLVGGGVAFKDPIVANLEIFSDYLSGMGPSGYVLYMAVRAHTPSPPPPAHEAEPCMRATNGKGETNTRNRAERRALVLRHPRYAAP
jgi:hypothetical protein